jgi:hypothetical protein
MSLVPVTALLSQSEWELSDRGVQRNTSSRGNNALTNATVQRLEHPYNQSWQNKRIIQGWLLRAHSENIIEGDHLIACAGNQPKRNAFMLTPGNLQNEAFMFW